METIENTGWRIKLIRRIGNRLKQQSRPRLQMSLIVAMCGFGGFFVSIILLELGLVSIWIRYALAVISAYFIFLGSVWVWIHNVRRRDKRLVNVPDAIDILDVPDLRSSPTHFEGGGGQSGGGGASASFDTTDQITPTIHSDNITDSSFDIDLDLDESIVIIAFLAAILSAVAASIYVIVTAPAFFAELIIDGVLSVSLYRRLKHIQEHHWFNTALRHTIVPFLIVVLFFIVSGVIMQIYAPEARSIGDVWKHYLSNSR